MAGVYLSEAPLLLGFCLGWSSNFVGSESRQIESVKLQQNMVSKQDSTHPPPPPPPPQQKLKNKLTHGRGGGGVGFKQNES